LRKLHYLKNLFHHYYLVKVKLKEYYLRRRSKFLINIHNHHRQSHLQHHYHLSGHRLIPRRRL
jgi:hypothetical protein